MDLHVSLTKPKENILPDGIDGYLLDDKAIEHLKTDIGETEEDILSGNDAAVRLMSDSESHFLLNKVGMQQFISMMQARRNISGRKLLPLCLKMLPGKSAKTNSKLNRR